MKGAADGTAVGRVLDPDAVEVREDHARERDVHHQGADGRKGLVLQDVEAPEQMPEHDECRQGHHLGEAVFHDCLPSFVDEGPAPVRSGARTGNCAPAEAEILPPEVCIGTAPTDGGGLIGKSSETESPVTVHPFVQTFLRVEMSQPSPNEV